MQYRNWDKNGGIVTEGTERGVAHYPELFSFMKTPLQMVILGSLHFVKMSGMLEFPQRGKGRHERVGSSSHCGCVVFIHSLIHPPIQGLPCWLIYWPIRQPLMVHSDQGVTALRWFSMNPQICHLHFTLCFQHKHEFINIYLLIYCIS